MQPSRIYHTTEDFLADESFKNWVLKGTHQQDWAQWSLEHPEHAKHIETARLCLLAMKVEESEVSKELIQAALEKTREKIAAAEKESSAGQKIRRLIGFRVAAAMLLLILIAAWLYRTQWNNRASSFSYQELIQKSPEGLIEQTNNTNKPQLLTLSDGSSILLYPQSKLSYPKSFALKERKVYLSGEGFFEISKNPDWPFLVMANEVVTKVLGTSFRIKAYDTQADVEVMVHTGKVDVSSKVVKNKKSASLLLLPNQGVRFLREKQAFQKLPELDPTLSKSPAQTNIEHFSFEFTDVPLTQILETIEKAYLVEIEFPVEQLKNCYLTTSLSDQPLPEKLKILCESLSMDSHYEMNGNKITILSKGCE